MFELFIWWICHINLCFKLCIVDLEYSTAHEDNPAQPPKTTISSNRACHQSHQNYHMCHLKNDDTCMWLPQHITIFWVLNSGCNRSFWRFPFPQLFQLFQFHFFSCLSFNFLPYPFRNFHFPISPPFLIFFWWLCVFSLSPAGSHWGKTNPGRVTIECFLISNYI